MLFFRVLSVCLGLDPGSPEAAELIVPAYQDPENAPRLPRDRDLVCYALLEDPGGENLWQTCRLENDRPVTEAFPGFRLLVVCYGPHCVEHAHTIRCFLFLDGPEEPRALLRRQGVYPIPSPPLPTVLHEEAGSLWRKRADLTVFFRFRLRLPSFSPLSPLSEAPAVILHPSGSPRGREESP